MKYQYIIHIKSVICPTINGMLFPSKIVKFLLILLMFPTVSNAFEQFGTTHLESTSGAGVGSLLMDEATFLNPATIGFFNVSSLYYQKSKADIDIEPKETAEATSGLYILSDSKGNVGASLSYQNFNQGIFRLKRMAIALGTPVTEKSSIGISYIRKSSKQIGSAYEAKASSMLLGFFYAASPKLTFGMTCLDPSKNKLTASLTTIGIQYYYEKFIGIILDLGADHTRDLSDTLLYRAALQFKILYDFYLKFGVYNNDGDRSHGNSAGIGWVQPKFVLNLAVKNNKRLNNTELVTRRTDRSTSFSIAYRY